MPKEVFEFSCPCCDKRIELNARNGKVRAVNFEESKRGKNFDDLVKDQKKDGERLGSVFDEARGEQSTELDRLDDLFSDAKNAAKKDNNKKPPHPFMDT